MRIAGPGAVVNHSGAWAWLAQATIRARGLDRARLQTRTCDTIAAAPSEIEEDEAAVTVPLALNAGFRCGIRSISTPKGVSSGGDDVLALARRDSDGSNLGLEVAFLHGPLRAPHGLRSVAVLVGTSEAVCLGRNVCEAAHRLAVPWALQAVVKHVVDESE